MALDELLLGDAGFDFEVVDVLGVVCEELAALVEHGDELVSGCVAVSVGEDVLGDRVENGGILLEDINVKDLLRIIQAQVFQLGVETGALGTEIRNAERGRDAGASEQDNVFALLD